MNIPQFVYPFTCDCVTGAQGQVDPVKAVFWALLKSLQITWPQTKDKLGERLGRNCPIWQIIKLGLAMPMR